MNLEILHLIISFSIPVIGYFLKRSLDDVKSLKDMTWNTQKDLEILKTDHLNKYSRLEEKFDNLFDAVKDLTKEIKSLNGQLSRKKDI